MICNFEGCDRKIKVRGFCKSHYQQMIEGREMVALKPHAPRNTIVPWIVQAIQSANSEDCIYWPFGTTTRDGHVRPSRIAYNGDRSRYPAHIVLEMIGEIRPSSKHGSLHSCDNPTCINPNHLRWGTPKENTEDALQRGRHITQRHEKLIAWLDENGIEFPEEMR